MRKAFVYLVSLLFSLAMFGQEDFSKVQIKVAKVGGSVYMLEGAGGNIAASVGEDGIVVVDDQYAPLADKIQAALKGITDKPVRFVINTHYHFDHTDGNLAFAQGGAAVLALAGVLGVRDQVGGGDLAGGGGHDGLLQNAP